MWVSTDKDGYKSLWERKPERSKNGKEWLNGGKRIPFGEFPLEDLPSFVQQQEWKDAPIQVKLNISKR
jgi:hypothetical protein